MNRKNKIILELVLVNLFILNLAVGSISNFSFNVFLLKAVSSFLLIVATLIVFIKQKSGIQNPVSSIQHSTSGIPAFAKLSNPNEMQLSSGGQAESIKVGGSIWLPVSKIWDQNFIKGLKKISFVIIVFVAYLTITLSYSSNPSYGFQKLLNFTICIIPSIFVSYYLLSTISELRIRLFIYSIITISIITVAYILIDYPFDQSTIYHFQPGRWSHVIYGRIISSFAVVLLLYLITLKQKKQVLLYSIFATIAFYGTYLSALRAAIVGVILVVLVLIVLEVILSIKGRKDRWEGRNQSNYLFNQKYQIDGLLVTILITVLLVVFIPGKEIIKNRIENLESYKELDFEGDPAIHSRLSSWKLSWEIFQKQPVWGVGFGGFNGYASIEWTRVIKYPHNIFLEIAVEGGIIGLLVLSSVLFLLFKSLFHFSIFPSLFFLFTLFLAMFSKDISSQSILWIGIAFYPIKGDKIITPDIN